jgi:hypothetical protein
MSLLPDLPLPDIPNLPISPVSLLSDILPTFPGGNNRVITSFIVVLNRGVGFPVKDIIPFQFLPNIIRDSKNAVYNDIPIIARSVPVKNYSYSNSRTISFTLEFFTSPEQGPSTIFTPLTIKTRIDALRALVYPDYSGFIVKPPPRCIVMVGLQLAFMGVCRNVSVSYSNQSPWDLFPAVLAHHATVDLSFEEALNIPLSNTEVRLGLPMSISGNELSGTFSPGGLLGDLGNSVAPAVEAEVQGPSFAPAGIPTGFQD